MRTPAHESTLPPILGVSEMAALLGLSKSGLYNAMKRPGWLYPPLPALDRAPRWSREEVLATLTAPRLSVARRRG
jgi:predicted DNA-binding transcriptional regulator AlpA